MPAIPSFTQRRATHLRLGARGERLALRLLGELGIDVLVRNYATPKGEIDIIARENRVLCFIEVKTRRHHPGHRPADAVTATKRQRIIKAARAYLRVLGFPNCRHRYDIVEITLEKRAIRKACYWRNAFNEDREKAAAHFPDPDGFRD